MKLKSLQELEQLFAKYICTEVLPDSSYEKTRYVDNETWDSFINYELDFEPYISVSKKCGMSALNFFRSPTTNRFYIGFLNTGGHGARGEARPVKIEHLKDCIYLEKMYANHGQQLDQGIDINENYIF